MSEFILPEQYYPSLPRKYASASLLVPVGGRFLVLKKSYNGGQLTLPGGVCELNQSMARTALREAKEEIGLDLEIDRLGNVAYQKTDAALKGRGDCCHYIFFSKPISEQQMEKIKLADGEIAEFSLMTKEELFEARDKLQTPFFKKICAALDGMLYLEY